MFVLRHRFLVWTTKIILTIICVSFFTEQASYKFYQFSSSRSFAKAKKTTGSALSDAGIKLSVGGNHSRSELRPLDKRFDVSQFFILFSIPTAPVPSASPEVKYPICPQTEIAGSGISTAPNRGPPPFPHI